MQKTEIFVDYQSSNTEQNERRIKFATSDFDNRGFWCLKDLYVKL